MQAAHSVGLSTQLVACHCKKKKKKKGGRNCNNRLVNNRRHPKAWPREQEFQETRLIGLTQRSMSANSQVISWVEVMGDHTLCPGAECIGALRRACHFAAGAILMLQKGSPAVQRHCADFCAHPMPQIMPRADCPVTVFHNSSYGYVAMTAISCSL